MPRTRLLLTIGALLLLGAPACDDETGAATDGSGQLGDGTGSGDGGGGGGDLPFQSCASVTETAKNTFQPVDIVIIIDNSPSMLDELNATRANMNKFSKTISGSGLDHHIVLISCLPGDCDNDKFHGICIDPPLGKTGGCTAQPPADTNLPRFMHVSIKVPSTKGLERTISTHGQWKSMMRPGAARHVVIISDDTDEYGAAQFNDALIKLDPGFAGYKFHGIFAFASKEAACAVSKTEPCCTYAAPGGEGVPYKELVKLTGGVQADLCQQSFDPVFGQIATSVIKGAKLSCSWPLPAPPDGKQLDPTKINVEYVDGSGARMVFGKVSGAADCSKVKGDAWYYDNEAQPTKVLVCPQTCTKIQGQTQAQMVIHFGCKTEIAPIE
jgi:hypothetical protein